MRLFFLAIVLLAPMTLLATDKTMGLAYNEGLAVFEIDLLGYDSRFESTETVTDNTTNNIRFKINNYKFFYGTRGRLGINYEIRGVIEHYNFHTRDVINAKCNVGVGPEIVLGAGGFLSAYLGYTFCSSQFRQSELYVLDTTSPTKNPYENSMNKYVYGIAMSFEPEGFVKEYGARLTYSMQTVQLRIYDVDTNSSPDDIYFQMYGLEVYRFF